jgi:hypothetical protein
VTKTASICATILASPDLNGDDAIWDVTAFTKNRERLLVGDIAAAFLQKRNCSTQGRGKEAKLSGNGNLPG